MPKKKKKRRYKILYVDKHKLDDEASEQPEKFLIASDKASKIRKEKLLKERDISILDAKLGNKYRKDPERYFGKGARATDKAVIERLNLSPKLNRLKEELIEIKYKLERAENSASATEQRRSSIKYLAELWMKQYWGDVSIDPGDESDYRLKQRRKD